jgi:hypothetical protein
MLARDEAFRYYNAGFNGGGSITSAADWEFNAAGLFDVAVLAVGIGLGALAGLVSLRWHGLMRWLRRTGKPRIP